jgi:hypothetical protein
MNQPYIARNGAQPAIRRLLLAVCLLGPFIVGNSLFLFPTYAQSPYPPRRVNIPCFSGEVDWAQTAIFWFGKNEQGVPSRNYADVRVAYNVDAFHVRITIVDYYLWYRVKPASTDDLTQYDAVAITLDTDFDRAATPQIDDYTFLIGAHHWPNENATEYHRQARGTGTSWDTTWTNDWTDYEVMQWSCNPGPNSNECGIDYGWVATFTIPWGTLAHSGPPPKGTLWGLGVLLYDRDDESPAGYVAPEPWPETFGANGPATWGELHFGYADYELPLAVPRGTTVIRATSPEDDAVEDAWMGGGGNCSGGHEGGSEINHGEDTGLFVGTETAPTHFPCFNKSYLRFSLDAIPPGQTILSATLTLHHWGNADPGQARPSWVHLFIISDPWQEMTIHWNNAPPAQENVAANWIYPITEPVGWPGTPCDWDATYAVAEAYAEGHPVSVAIYGSDTAQHSSKYLTSSETGDWNTEGRPTLTVAWGQPLGVVNKQVRPVAVTNGDIVTYTLSWLGTGQTLSMADTLPSGLSAPGPINPSSGEASYNPIARQVVWTGEPAAGQAVTVTFPVTVQVGGPLALRNTAVLTANSVYTSSDTALIIVDGYSIYLPRIMKP